jgi:hypothetical protein
MKWCDLSDNAKSVLEWVKHVWTNKDQLLFIVKEKSFIQYDTNIFISEELFTEISEYLLKKEHQDLHYTIGDDLITVALKTKYEIFDLKDLDIKIMMLLYYYKDRFIGPTGLARMGWIYRGREWTSKLGGSYLSQSCSRLTKKGLVRRNEKGHYQITNAGIELIK